ncbi:MAG: hypothetical protein F4138_03910 [Acidimicrobiia bacterium]|nr:hypothetical protein [Acidimicrobiia bacterium]MYG94122.1 hypothetical protein [Acidimicrobiia bacterium]
MLAVMLVVAIAIYTVLRVSSRLAHSRARVVYDLAEAVEFVSERLPETLTAKLSYDDVEALLLWHVDHLRVSGAATYGRGDLAAAAAEGNDEGIEVVTNEDDIVDYVLAKASSSGRDIEALDVVVVLDLERAYLEQIGALGPPVVG